MTGNGRTDTQHVAIDEKTPDLRTRRVVLEKEIPSDPTLVTPVVLRVANRLLAEGVILPECQEKVQLCLTEAVKNAVVHGNHGDFSRKIRLSVFVDDAEWGVLVEDEGSGFDPETVPDPAGDDLLWGESGRGLSIMRHYMDRVEHYAGGRALLMVRKR